MTLELTEEDILRLVKDRFGSLIGDQDHIRLVVRAEPAVDGDRGPRVSVAVTVHPYPKFKSTHVVVGANL